MKRIFLLIMLLFAVVLLPAIGLIARRGEISPREDFPRLLIIGVDGADWSIIDPLLDENRLPNLAELRNDSVYGTLMSIDPTLSPIIWTTILTGRSRQYHRISGFTDNGSNNTMLSSLKTREVPALWDICSHYGLRCGVVGPLLGWPAEPIDGFFIGDTAQLEALGKQNSKVEEGFFPDQLFPELADLVVQRDGLTPEQWLPLTDLQEVPELNPRNRRQQLVAQKIDMLKSAIAKDCMAVDMAVKAMTDHPVDVCFVYLRATDTSCHKFWQDREGKVPGSPFEDTIDRVYEWTDSQIGRLLEFAGPQTHVLIVSDHGFKGMGMGDPITDHRPQGVILWSGTGARKGPFKERTSILEVFPLMAYLLEIPLSEELNGQFPAHLVEEEWIRENPVSRVSSYSIYRKTNEVSEEKTEESLPPEKLVEDLKALGYIQ